jgi:hypothetical protein
LQVAHHLVGGGEVHGHLGVAEVLHQVQVRRGVDGLAYLAADSAPGPEDHDADVRSLLCHGDPL